MDDTNEVQQQGATPPREIEAPTRTRFYALSVIEGWPGNPREHDEPAIQSSIDRFGFKGHLMLDVRSGRLVRGHGRIKDLRRRKAGGETPPAGVIEYLGEWYVAVELENFNSDAEAEAFIMADNRVGQLGGWMREELEAMAKRVADATGSLQGTGFTSDGLAAVFTDVAAAVAASVHQGPYGRAPSDAKGRLVERFGVPPFSVLDARQGYWQERKRAWLAMGIRSEAGRDENLLFDSSIWIGGGTSVFDPVLAELAYRWFCPPRGRILDPFAGGSVRGIVAARLGRAYTGVDLRARQVAENRAQWAALGGLSDAVAGDPDEVPVLNPDALTPVQLRAGVWMKRDDLFEVNGVPGGKVRTCWRLAQGAAGLVTAGSRSSPQVNIVAHVAQALGIPCRVHTPTGELSPEVVAARDAGAEVVQHRAGYNTVIVKRARDDAAALGWTEIPFGMECAEAVAQTRRQVANLPAEAQRLVMPVGSGMSLAGVLWGLADIGRKLPVVGVVVGADPEKRLDEYAPPGWRDLVQLVPSGSDYHQPAAATTFGGVDLDPHYEAKAVPFIRPGDCFWIVGVRQTHRAAARLAPHAPALGFARDGNQEPQWLAGDSRQLPTLVDGEYDFVFTCPPYADLEVYSEDPADLSTMPYAAFLEAYREIIANAAQLLRQDRFLGVVVGEVRDPRDEGAYYNFVGDTVRACMDAGLRYYNEAIVVTPAGSLPIRVVPQFEKGRKLGKTHQNLLVFVKGDPIAATAAVGPVEFGEVGDPAAAAA